MSSACVLTTQGDTFYLYYVTISRAFCFGSHFKWRPSFFTAEVVLFFHCFFCVAFFLLGFFRRLHVVRYDLVISWILFFFVGVGIVL